MAVLFSSKVLVADFVAVTCFLIEQTVLGFEGESCFAFVEGFGVLGVQLLLKALMVI